VTYIRVLSVTREVLQITGFRVVIH
jgi:hypothetical protein